MINLLVMLFLSATSPLQTSPSSSGGVRDRLDRIMKDTGERWILVRSVLLPARPRVSEHDIEIYEWRNPDRNERVHITVEHYSDAAQAREHVEHLIVEAPSGPLNGIGDAARIAFVQRTGPGTVHFSVDWMYVQLSAPTVDLAIKLAGKAANELRP